MTDIHRDIEKNDVDIAELFRWNKEIEIQDVFTQSKVKFYMRLLGDADLGKARVYGYRKSAELRRKLKNIDSDERVALLAELADFGEADIILRTIEILRVPEIYQSALKNVDVKEPKEPAEDDLQTWEEYQAEVDSYSERFRDAVDKEAERLRHEDSKVLKKKTKEELYAIYENEVIGKVCQEEMNNAFYDMAIYLATFKDEKFKNLAFKSFDSYNNVHPTLKSRLKEEYQSLELGIDVLKKLQEVTE